MKHFIFLTHEGFTTSPNDTDIENLQVLGISEGDNKEKAFKELVKDSKHLLHTDFDEVVAMELANEKRHYFSLKNHN